MSYERTELIRKSSKPFDIEIVPESDVGVGVAVESKGKRRRRTRVVRRRTDYQRKSIARVILRNSRHGSRAKQEGVKERRVVSVKSNPNESKKRSTSTS